MGPVRLDVLLIKQDCVLFIFAADYSAREMNRYYWLNLLRTKNNIFHLNTHRAVNTLRLGYKNQSVKSVQGNNRCSF